MRLAPEELERWNAALDEMQWSDRHLSRLLGVSEKTPVWWRIGRVPIPHYAWAFVQQALSIKRAYDPLMPCPTWRTHSRGNPKRKARMDAQALQRFKDAGKL